VVDGRATPLLAVLGRCGVGDLDGSTIRARVPRVG
jgi:hypothetical protein